MPTCKRCDRTGATSEFRRSPSGGHLCMDKPRCERDRLAGLTNWAPLDARASNALSAATGLVHHVSRRDTMEALGTLAALHNHWADLAGDLCVAASREGKTTKDIAATLGVSTSMLRGLKSEARAA
jgi:hypothetical protein